MGTKRYEWRRTCQVVTLGELFLVLGKRWRASAIYYFYRTLRLVAVKRRKTTSGDAQLGLTRSNLQGAQIRRALVINKDQLVEEYAVAMNLGEQSPTTELFDSAVRYLHMLLLRDLRPPWLAYKFPQALSGEGVLSRYTRPSFLQWPIDFGAVVFGEGVVAMLRKVTSAVGVDVAGLLARPVYACTNIRGHGGMCMSVASMSEFVQQGSGRGPYLCQECVSSGAGLPVSDSKPLRVLHLYALVSARDGGLTPLRMKAVRMVLRAPPAN